MGWDARIFIDGAVEPGGGFLAEIGNLLSPNVTKDDRIFVGLDDGYTSLEGYERYFGRGYARGNWPRIKAAILRTIEEFPASTIRYGHDGTDPSWAPEATPELLSELDEEWGEFVEAERRDGRG